MASYYYRHGRVWDRAVFESSWPGTDNYCLLENGVLVGVLRCSSDAEYFYVRDMQVVPQAQNRGLGTFALKYAQNLCKAMLFKTIRLRVFEDNPARTLYGRMGFSELLKQNGLLLLEKDLA